MALKSFRDIVHELKMKRDKKLPNLKTPVKGPKGTSSDYNYQGPMISKVIDVENLPRPLAAGRVEGIE